MTSCQVLFDNEAQEYDTNFSHTELGRYYRKRTHLTISKYLDANSNILEINAGTGEDAIHLAKLGHKVLATEISSAMLKIIGQKINAHNYQQKVNCRQLDILEMAKLAEHNFDAILSNFGGLNCINQWQRFGSDSSKLLRPGGILITCVMGPMVPWEWVYFIAKGKLSKAFRRVNGECEWREHRIYYPTISKFEKSIRSNSFELVHREAIGTLMPPSYMSEQVIRWKKSFTLLAKIEEMICQTKMACRFSDHYLLVFRRN